MSTSNAKPIAANDIQVGSDRQLSIRLGGTLYPVINQWGGNFFVPGNASDTQVFASTNSDDTLSVALRSTRMDYINGVQTNVYQWQYASATLNKTADTPNISISYFNMVQYPSTTELLMGFDMNGDGAVGVVKTTDKSNLGSVKLQRDSDNRLYLDDAQKEISLNTNPSYENSSVYKNATTFSSPSGFKQTGNYSNNKVIAVEQGNIFAKTFVNTAANPSNFNANGLVDSLEVTLDYASTVTRALLKDTVFMGATTGYSNSFFADLLKATKTNYLADVSAESLQVKMAAAADKAWKDVTASLQLTADPNIKNLEESTNYWIIKKNENGVLGYKSNEKPENEKAYVNNANYAIDRIDKSGVSQDFYFPNTFKYDVPASILEYFIGTAGADLNGDGVVGHNLTLSSAVAAQANANYALLKDSDANFYLYIKAESGSGTVVPITGAYQGTFENDNIMGGKRTVKAIMKLEKDEQVAQYKKLLNFETTIETSTKSQYLIASSDASMDGTANWNFYQVELDPTTKTASLKQQKWSKSASDWEDLFKLDLNNDKTIGKGDIKPLAGDVGLERLYTDSDGAFYIVEGQEITQANNVVEFNRIGSEKKLVDQWGNTPYFSATASAMGGQQLLAVVKAKASDFNDLVGAGATTGTIGANGSASTVDQYYLLIKNQHMMSSETRTDYYIMPVSETGTFQYNQTRINTLSKAETFFKQDLDGDKIIGFNANSIAREEKDLGSVYVGRVNGALLVVDATNSGSVKYFEIKSSNAGYMEMEYAQSWGQGSNSRQAMAAEKYGNDYYIIYKQTNSWTEYAPMTSGSTPSAGTLRTDINYEVHKLTLSTDQKALLSDWKDVTRTKNVVSEELKFQQDLNGDKSVGPDLTKLATVATDKTGALLKRSTLDDSLYIADGADIKILTNTQGLENSNTWMNGSFKSEAIAVEKQIGGKYKLAVKQTNTYTMEMSGAKENRTDINWTIFTLDETGKVLNGMTMGSPNDSDMPISTKSVATHESLFNQDLNGDGAIGVDASKFTVIDAKGAKLAKDNEGTLYVIEGNNSTEIPNSSWFEYSNSWGQGSSKRQVLAVEKANTGFVLALKTTNTYNGTTDQNWEIWTLGSNLQIDWSKNIWTNNVNKYENLFQQDLNDDGVIGLDLTKIKLDLVSTDLGDAVLARDAAKSLYIKLDSSILAIDGSSGLEYENSWTNWDGKTYANKREVFAVENFGTDSQPDYVLALKSTNTNAGVSDIRWEMIRLDGTLRPRWDTYNSTKSVAAFEQSFKQDLNGDTKIGLDVTDLVDSTKDTTGATLARDGEKALYIKDGNNLIAIENSGWFEFENSWSGGSYKREAIAAEKIPASQESKYGKGYVIAFKNTNVIDQVEQVNWEVMRLDEKGAMVKPAMAGNNGSTPAMPTSIWTKSIASFEGTLFGQDLNGDGAVGIDLAKLTAEANDKGAQTLYRDSDKALYIVDGQAAPLPIANSAWFEYANVWGQGASARKAIAVEKVTTGGTSIYKVLLEKTNTFNGKSDTSYEIFRVDDKGEPQFATIGGTNTVINIQAFEKEFDQDFDGDGAKGIPAVGLTAYITDANLLKDASSNLFIKSGTESILVTDSNGNALKLDTQSTAYSATPYAVKLKGSQYTLAVKVVETVNGTATESWQLHQVSDKGVLDWSKSSFTRNANIVERTLNLDLKTGGAPKTLTVQDLTEVATDTANEQLYKDASGALYYTNDSNKLIYVVDQFKGSPVFDSTNASTSANSRVATAVAINEVSDTDINLAVKVVSTGALGTNTSWEIYKLAKSLDGDAVIDWKNTVFTDNVLLVERLLGEDLNGDGNATGSASVGDVQTLITDKAGVGAEFSQETGEGWVIVDASTSINIVNSAGLPIKLQDASIGLTFMAVSDLQSSPTVSGVSGDYYMIATRLQFVNDAGETDTSWTIHYLEASSNKVKASVVTHSIAGFEEAFGQDLNGDLIQGLPTEQFAIATDPTKNAFYDSASDGGIYLLNANNTAIALKDDVGNRPVFDYSETLFDGTALSSQLFAVERVTANNVDSYLLAVKSQQTRGDEQFVTWTVHTANEDGIIDWSQSVVTEDISDYEVQFGFDMDGRSIAFIA